MNLRVLRIAVVVVCIGGIVGMIVGSVAGNNNGVVITFGLVTAMSVVVLMAVSAAGRSSPADAAAPVEELAAAVETRVEALVATGADEKAVRALVGDAVRLGKARGASPYPRQP